MGLALAAAFLFLLALYPPAVLRDLPHAAGRAGMIAVVAVLLSLLLRAWGAKRVRPLLFLAAVFGLALLEIGNSTGFDYVHVEDKASLVRPRLYQTTAGLAAFLRSRIGSDRVSYVYDDLIFNFGDWYGIPSVAGFLPSAPEASWRLGLWNPRILDLYSVRYWIGRQEPGGQKPADAGPEVFGDSHGWKVWQRPTALPRAWVAHLSKVAHSPEEAIRLTLDPATDLRSTVVLDREIPIESCPETAAATFTAIDEQYLRVDAAPACAGVLVLADNWYPGWEATLDGKRIDILRADAAIRGVAVPAGPHRIEMRYRPARIGLGRGAHAGGRLSCGVACRKGASSEDDPPHAVDAEGGGTRHPQVRHPPGVPQQSGEHRHRQRAQDVPVERLGNPALGECKDGVGKPAERAGASGQPPESAEREIGRREHPEQCQACREGCRAQQKAFYRHPVVFK